MTSTDAFDLHASTKVGRIYGGLGRFVVKWRWVVVAIWVVGTFAAVSSMPSLASQVNNNQSDFLPASAPSTQAAKLAKPLIGTLSESQIQVVAVTSNSSLGGSDEVALKQLSTNLLKVKSVTKVSFLAASPDGKAAQLLVISSTPQFDETKISPLVDNLQKALDSTTHPKNLSLQLAGQIPTEVAQHGKSDKQSKQILTFSFLFILGLLFVIFRSALAPLITLFGPLFALSLSGSFIGELGAHGLKISFFTQILLTILLLGAGTDYGLFLVFRVREEMLSGTERRDAVSIAMARVGESISASALTVICALLTLTLASFGIYHDLGIPLAIGVVVMLLAGMTLLPALLAIFGRAAFWPSKTLPKVHGDGLWGRVAGRLVKRPALTLAIGTMVFVLLAVATFGIRIGGFGGSLKAPAGTNAAKGNQALTSNFHGANSDPTNVVMRFPNSVWTDPTPLQVATASLRSSGEFTSLAGPLDPNGLRLPPAEISRLHTVLKAAPQKLAASSTAARTTSRLPVSRELFQAYLSTARFISADGKTVQWEAGLTAGSPESNAALQAMTKIRAAVNTAGKKAGASANGVAGQASAFADVSKISSEDLRHIIPIATLAIALVLLVVLRSLIAPLYLIVSVVLSYLASLGLAVLLFMKAGGQQGIVFLLPFLMFVFLLALGEDYNILVMTRIREEAHTYSLRRAVVRAVGATGPTVTSAGLVLAGSFCVLALVGGAGSTGEAIREIGFGLAIGILLDTFVVRTVLVPSTVALLGRWNWWPAALSREDVHAAVNDGDPEGEAPLVGAGTAP